MSFISIDCETTGLDVYHGARPFFVTTCDDRGQVSFWEWEVDPRTREVNAPLEDVEELKDLIWGTAHELILQNGKFDIAALGTLCPSFPQEWPWHRTHDTLIAAHVLASNKPKDLTSLGVMYLGVDISKAEEALKEVVQLCRIEARKLNKQAQQRDEQPPFAIATEGRPDMPSAGEDTWKFDLWLPRAMADHLGHDEGHPWREVLRTYANTDSALTAALWPVMRAEIERRKLMNIYGARMAPLPVAVDMERRGVTFCGQRMDEIYTEFKSDSERAGAKCQNIADGYTHSVPCDECVKRGKSDYKRSQEGKLVPKNRKPCKVCGADRNEQEQYKPRVIPFRLDMPSGAAPNNSLRTFVFDVLKLPQMVGKKSKTGSPTLDKSAFEYYLNTLPKNEKPYAFVKAMTGKKTRDTSLSYMNAYRRFALPVEGTIWLLHPSLNPTGTDTLRWSSERPNEQNISKKGMLCLSCLGLGCVACGDEGTDPRNVRYCFGPPPGYEWWSCDAKNIELRIPFYYSNEEELIALFEKPDEAPYYGSTHLLNFHTVYEDIWNKELAEVGIAKVGPHCKKKYAATWYQYCKNGGFCKQYGGQRALTDATFRRAGAFDLIDERFSKLTQLNRQCIAYAEEYGYVETIPDRTVDPERGYPLLCTRTEHGSILPTVPLSYFAQGTAMQWTAKAMVRTFPVLNEWETQARRRKERYPVHRVVMQVHDEIVFELPARANPKTNPKASNLGRVKELARLMSMGGDDIGIPTPVSAEWHSQNWCEGVTMF